jgi:hypothetical protein
MASVADTSAPSFNEFLDFFNGVTFNDENTLSEICTKEEDEPLPDPKDVKAAMYKPQKYYRRDDAGRVSFYVAWTLFAVWTDGTMRCWMKATDILRGIGYEDGYMKQLKSYVSGEQNLVPWISISKYIFYPHASFSQKEVWGKECGSEEANKLPQNTLFLTENGVIQLHQQSPKCKTFRNTIANFLLYVRSKLASGTVLVSKQRLEELEKRAGESTENTADALPAITDSERAEYDQKIQELREKLEMTREEHERREMEMKEELKVVRQELADAREAVEKITETKVRLEGDLERLNNEKILMQDQLERQRSEMVQMDQSIAQKAEMIKQADKVIRSMSRIMSNPRCFSMNDGLTPISQEPCAFMVSFGFLLVDGEMRPGLSVFRQQRRTLVRTGKQLFNAPPRRITDLEAVSFRRQIRHDYGVLGILREKRLALIEDFALPLFYSADDFIYPHCDKMLNDSERFLLLNTTNAVSFVNALLEMNRTDAERRVTDANVLIEQRRDAENSQLEAGRMEVIEEGEENDARLKEMAALLRRQNQRRQYKRKRGSSNVDDARRAIAEDVDEDERARATKRLIERIVFDDPALKPALTLRRYKYQVTSDQAEDDEEEEVAAATTTRSAATVFYSTDPVVPARDILRAVFMLWQKLTEAMRIATTTSLEECLRDLLAAL